LGFIEAPYRKVSDGRVVEYVRVIYGGDTKLSRATTFRMKTSIRQTRNSAPSRARLSMSHGRFYLTAWEEDKHVVGQANIELDADGHIVNERKRRESGRVYSRAGARTSNTSTFRRSNSFGTRRR
jgi:DNA-directed RNA polymerase subunit beta